MAAFRTASAPRVFLSPGGDYPLGGSGSEGKPLILPGTADLEPRRQKNSLHIETPIEFITASPPMRLLRAKPAKVLLYYTGADRKGAIAQPKRGLPVLVEQFAHN